MSHDEFSERLQPERRIPYYPTEYLVDGRNKVRVVEGNLEVSGNLLMENDAFEGYGLIVTGDLNVSGAIMNTNVNYGPFLLVGGTTHAYAIVAGGATFVFEGQTTVDELILGHDNDGMLIFRGDVTAPVVLNWDHFLDIRGTLNGRAFRVGPRDEQTPWHELISKQAAGRNLLEEGDNWEWTQRYMYPALKQKQRVIRDDLMPTSN